MKKFLFIFTAVFFSIGILVLGIYLSTLPIAGTKANTLTQISGEITLCQQDVFLCDNGAYVTRDSSKSCEFDCTNTSAPLNGIITCPKDLRQCGDGSFVIRDPNNKCEFKAC